MDSRTIIQTIGGIAKEELLKTIEHHVMANTLVLENSEPFPGYHGTNLPEDKAPMHLFLITTEHHSAEKIIRVNHQIHKYFTHTFEASSAKICIENNNFPGIRVKDLDNYGLINELQACFVDEGILFARKRKINSSGIIQVKKHFVLEEVAEGIYKDLEESHMHYLQIPIQVKWKPFRMITERVKNNVDNNNFDAALGAFYLRDVTDVVRIYSTGMGLDSLQKLKEIYSVEMLRYEA